MLCYPGPGHCRGTAPFSTERALGQREPLGRQPAAAERLSSQQVAAAGLCSEARTATFALSMRELAWPPMY